MELVTLYVHKESNKVVSRLCTGCQAVKLLEEFSSDRVHRGTPYATPYTLAIEYTYTKNNVRMLRSLSSLKVMLL